MRSKLTTLLTVIGAVTVLVLAANSVALATTGKALLAGKINSAGKTTTVKRTTQGPVLTLTTRSGANAPLQTNGRGKVVNLNADTVDGLDSAALRSPSYVFTKAITDASTTLELPINVPTGNYLVSYSVLMVGAGTGEVGCSIKRVLGSETRVAESRFVASSVSAPSVTGSGYVTKPAGATLALKCDAGAPFTTLPAEPVQIVLTRADVASSTVLRTAP